MNVAMLNRVLRARGLSRRQLARALGISPGRFGAILAEQRDLEFSLGQLQVLRALLCLNRQEVSALFFAEELS